MGLMSFNEECLKGRKRDLKYTGKSSMSFMEILQKNGDRSYLRICQDRVVVYNQLQENKKMERFSNNCFSPGTQGSSELHTTLSHVKM